MLSFLCLIHDAAEGTLHVDVTSDDEDAAREEAFIAASERGCFHITEIEVLPKELRQLASPCV
jgi:hypothetical protein